MIPYVDQLILRYVILDDAAAFNELNRCIPAKYHLAHFSSQHGLFIPFISKSFLAKKKLEDQNSAKELLKKNSSKNLLLLSKITEIFKKAHEAKLDLIITSNLSSYFFKLCEINERAFESATILVRAEDINKVIECLTSCGFKTDVSEINKKIKYDHKVVFEFYDYSKIEICCSLHGKKIDYFLKQASEFSLADVDIRTLNPSLSFFNAYTKTLNSTWLYDAYYIANKSNLDWNLIEKTAQDLDKTYYLLNSLRYLNQHFAVEIPQEMISSLQTQALSFAQKLEKTALCSTKFGIKEHLLFMYAEFTRLKKRKISQRLN